MQARARRAHLLPAAHMNERRQQRNGRRGFVFSVRLTEAERARAELAQALHGGPRALGPWLVWQALRAAPKTEDELAIALRRLGTGSSASPLRVPVTLSPQGVPGSSGYYRPSSGSTTTQRFADDGASPGQVLPPVAERVILDLCAGSGSWSKPYADAGYRVVHVTLPDADVRTYVPPENVWGVLAAPPCDQFSLARNGHPSPRDILRGMETVNACMRVVLQCRPRWWALENPVGLLSTYLGTPRDVFQPCDFGDPWTKRTALWGEFTLPERGPHVRPVGGGPLCLECDPERRATTWCNVAAHRAVTPPGFARAFARANP